MFDLLESDMDLELALPQLNNSNAIYTFRSPRQQNIPITYPIIKYIFTKPSSGKTWKKLIKTCKYFFSLNPIYPVERLKYRRSNIWDVDGKSFDLTKNIAKLWICGHIYAGIAPTLLSSLIPKMNKCDLRSLDIWYQHLTFDEYSFLTSTGDVRKMWIHRCTIKHSDGTLAKFDQLFINISKLEYFEIHFAENYSSMFKPDTFEKFAGMLPRLKEPSPFIIYGLTEEFDFTSITDFLLKNENLLIRLEYNRSQLSAGYKEILERFIAKIIETPPKRIPSIDFPGFRNNIYFKGYYKLCCLKKIIL